MITRFLKQSTPCLVARSGSGSVPWTGLALDLVTLESSAGAGDAPGSLRASSGTVPDANGVWRFRDADQHRVWGADYSGGDPALPVGVTTTTVFGKPWLDSWAVGLLLEPASTNHFRYSDDVTGGSGDKYTLNGWFNPTSFEQYNGTGLYGETNPYLGRLFDDTTTSLKQAGNTYLKPDITGFATLSVSFFHRLESGATHAIRYYSATSNGSTCTVAMPPCAGTVVTVNPDKLRLRTVGNWRRLCLASNDPRDNTSWYLLLYCANGQAATPNTTDYLATGALVWTGMQVEERPSVTTPIPTAGAPVSRASEAGRVRWVRQGRLDPAAGTLLIQFELPFVGSHPWVNALTDTTSRLGLVSVTGTADSLLWFNFSDKTLKAGTAAAPASVSCTHPVNLWPGLTYTLSDDLTSARGVMAAVRWDAAEGVIQVGWRRQGNATWTWSTPVPYAGELAAGDGYITLGAGIEHSLIIHNLVVLDSARSTAEIEGALA
ncbi:MAG: hypothetical protein H7831_03775 [Magnetococcus sp. WYHC-3]